ncbi:MAG TPA: DNA polymerase I [Tepidisphaeraceae bacterium]|nr:DNA polymerase I [Tepidisphaeraceae bacterium]
MPETFYIIDGHAQIYRAYYAPFRDLSSPTGEPVKATYVFIQRLLNIIETRKPDYLAMVIDTGEANLERRQVDPEYKANRKPPPPDFEPQEKRILQIVADIGIPIFALPGHEADDLMATMARHATAEGLQTMLISNDKDLRQLVNDSVRMFDPYTDTVTDSAVIREKFGYTPEQAVEIQTLIGDSTDNVPGIPGVGEKTAAGLIHRFGSVDEVLNHLDELTPKLRQNLTEHREILKRSRALVTLRNDLSFEWELRKCRFNGLNQKALRTHLANLGFTTLLKRLGEEKKKEPERFEEHLFSAATPAAAPQEHFETAADCTYHFVSTAAEFEAFLSLLKQQKRFAFDTETDALGALNSNLVGMSFSWNQRSGYYVPGKPEFVAAIKPILEDPSIAKVGHNIKYDIMVMRQAGVIVRGVALDSMIAAFLMDAGRMQYGIDRLALDLLNFKKIPTSDLIGSGNRQISMAKVDPQKVAIYASEDADIAWRLAERFDHQLNLVPQLRKLADEVETPLVDVLAEMEFNGIAVDSAILKEQSKVLAGRIDELRDRICREAGVDFNCDSPRQLADVLYKTLGLPVAKRAKTGPSTDMEALEKIAHLHVLPRLVRDYRGLVKLKNTYLDTLADFINPNTGRIHAHFNQIGAETGRLSCSDPNLQNIPIRTDEGNRIRLAFVPGDRERNVLLTADYSQIELRILAHLSGETALIKAFEADQDVHTAVAAEVFGVAPDQVTKDQRGQAKVINFGIIYGVSAYGLSWRIEGLTVQSAGALIEAYHKRFPAIEGFFEKCLTEARTQGFVQTILGRRRPITDIAGAVASVRNMAERQAINTVVQGSAADLIKVAMLNIHRRLKSENRPSRMLLQVHDELVFETPAESVESEADMVRQEMTGAMKLAVPLKVETGWGHNWQELK